MNNVKSSHDESMLTLHTAMYRQQAPVSTCRPMLTVILTPRPANTDRVSNIRMLISLEQTNEKVTFRYSEFRVVIAYKL